MGVLMTSNRIDVAAAISATAFIAVLAVAAWWDPSIRALHVFESLPYLLAAVLCLRRSKLGYALGFVSGAFWLWTGGLLTTFIRNGFERLEMLVRTGAVDRPDILIAVPAALAAAGLVVSAAIGYGRLPHKTWRDSAVLGAAVVMVPAYFIAIFAAFAPQYLGMFRRLVE
jgi:hypothetical protein